MVAVVVVADQTPLATAHSSYQRGGTDRVSPANVNANVKEEAAAVAAEKKCTRLW
jgi:hypothetical protein